MNEDLITVRQAAELSGYNIQHIRKLLRNDHIKGQKFGIVWQVSRQSLLDYLEASEESEDQRRSPRDK